MYSPSGVGPHCTVMSSISGSIPATVGALEVGILFAIFLSGVCTVQVYVYFHQYPKDPWGLKLLVALIWVLDLTHSILLCHLIYTITVTQYGRQEDLLIPPKSLNASLLISGLMGPLEQGWFTYRLFKFTKTLPLPVLCFTLSLLRLAGSIGLFSVSLDEMTLYAFQDRLLWLIAAVIIVGAAVDVILVVALCYHLRFWSRDGFQRMSRLVNQLMTWTIETGAITTTGALALLITFLTMHDNFIYIGFFVLMAKLFANSLLFSLNARERFAEICAEVLPTLTHVSHSSHRFTPLDLDVMESHAAAPTLPSPVSPSWSWTEFSAAPVLLRQPHPRVPIRIRTDVKRQSSVSFASPSTAASAY
ncbi:hypothetical protein FB45DRAFT_901199 [Roridomyces roridus]|uniref:DUF6534 domain-containing protein n=1 Tax=Roridomyces roridus TaxID=1738132 RepID=A0AAD7C8N4_9AGAR|nr:hypothetical protein FB45DRAFT_901199 [Roridomyces roridus]